MDGILRAWRTILAGNQPCLSIEITRECPLRCPGCYAYNPEHLGSRVTLRTLTDYRGDDLVDRLLALVRKERPLHVSLVGGEPLVRYRELGQILPALSRMGIHTHLVTSAVRPIPLEWARVARLRLIVSIDGLQPEHDARRSPATYDRILRHISGHAITVHCTVTRQQAQREGYLEEFVGWWSRVQEVQEIWLSLYTPQVGELSTERLRPVESAAGGGGAFRPRTAVPQARDGQGNPGRAGVAPPVAERVHLRAGHAVRVRGPASADYAVPAGWSSGLLELRMHGLGRADRGRAASPARRLARRHDLRVVQARRDGRTPPAPGGTRAHRPGAHAGRLRRDCGVDRQPGPLTRPGPPLRTGRSPCARRRARRPRRP